MEDVLSAPWINQDLEARALQFASGQLVPEHYREVADRRAEHVDKTLGAVRERLVKEVNHWSDRHIKLSEDLAAGRDVRMPLENVRRTIDDLTARLWSRQRDLESHRHVVAAPPVVVAGALVIPAGLLLQRQGQPGWSADPVARTRIERMAMAAVTKAEQAAGRTVIDVSAQKCGWDLTSMATAGNLAEPTRHIEVKGRAKLASTITVTRNEVMYGLNQADKFLLAIVLVDGDQTEGPFYLRQPFKTEPDWAVTSVNLDLSELLIRAQHATHFHSQR